MKNILYIIAITAGLFSCEKDALEIQGDTPAGITENKTQVVFIPSVTEQLNYNAERVPMTMTEDNYYLSGIANTYKAIVIKLTGQQWIIDTVFQGNVITSLSPWKSIIVTTDTEFSPIVTELRPGTYKMGLFINFSGVKWNDNLKKGYIVSSEAEISPTNTELPAAYTVAFADAPLINDPPEGSLEINRELFAGMTSFTVDKNDDLHAAENPGNVKIQLQRQVSRYRFLIRLREKQEGEDQTDFIATSYWFQGNITCNEGERFCDGINILGGPFYNDGPGCTSMPFYACTSGNYFLSKTDNRLYFMSVSSLEGIPSNVTSSTNYAPFILTDNTKTSGISCKISDILLSGRAGESSYICKEPVDLILKPNSIIEKVYELKVPIEYDADQNRFTIIYVNDPKEGNIFPPFYEWNAVKTEPETQNP